MGKIESFFLFFFRGLMMVRRWFVFCVFSLGAMGAAWADLSSCAKISDPDKKNYCLGTYSASGTYCDKIKNGELRRDCMFKAIRMQRDNTWKPTKSAPKTEE
jgi:hypothetical protein